MLACGERDDESVEKMKLFFILAIIAVVSVVIYFNMSRHAVKVYKGVLVFNEGARGWGDAGTKASEEGLLATREL